METDADGEDVIDCFICSGLESWGLTMFLYISEGFGPWNKGKDSIFDEHGLDSSSSMHDAECVLLMSTEEDKSCRSSEPR